MSNSTDTVLGLILWAVLAVLIGMGYLVFVDDPHVPDGIDASGLISHKVEATITAQAGWMVGESKDCLSIPMDARVAQAVSQKPGYAFYYVKCDDGPQRKIQVTFWGKENQPENRVAYWICKRTDNSFECRQTGADSVTDRLGGKVMTKQRESQRESPLSLSAAEGYKPPDVSALVQTARR